MSSRSLFSKEVGQNSILAKSWKPAIAANTALLLAQPLNSGSVDVWGHHVASFSPPDFLLGHVNDFGYAVGLGLLATRLSKGKLPLWFFPVGYFAVYSGQEILQGMSHAAGNYTFDTNDFKAYALGSLTLAGIDIMGRMGVSNKNPQNH